MKEIRFDGMKEARCDCCGEIKYDCSKFKTRNEGYKNLCLECFGAFIEMIELLGDKPS